MPAPRFTDAEVVVIGAGIVGLAAARALQLRGKVVMVLDKEDGIARHQSGHNSGVLHSGIYYRPRTAKARLVAAGRKMMIDRCRAEQIPLELCGKLVVATSDPELSGLRRLEQLGALHGIETIRLGVAAMRDVEPYVSGLAALAVPSAGVVDFLSVCESLRDEISAAGGQICLESEVIGLLPRSDSLEIRTAERRIVSVHAVNCAGLASDRVAQLAGAETDVSIVPFRGEYHELSRAADHLVRHLVYPVPDPSFPFLGVHVTRGVDGVLHVGPNAVLATAREGYRWSDVAARDVVDLARTRGVWRLGRRHWRTGGGEVLRSLSTRALIREVRRLVPDISAADLRPGGSGVRAQAIDRNGRLFDDFLFVDSPRMTHVVNAPSPAATASLAIGEEIANRVDRA